MGNEGRRRKRIQRMCDAKKSEEQWPHTGIKKKKREKKRTEWEKVETAPLANTHTCQRLCTFSCSFFSFFTNYGKKSRDEKKDT
jgi:hypothetical protein